VLLVEADPESRDRHGAWLEEAGYDVVVCTGPTGPDYTCVGSREGDCPLVHRSDLVVLDTDLDSEALMVGTPAEELLALYLFNGKPVIALMREGGPVETMVDEQLAHLSRDPDHDELVDTVRRLFEAKAVSGPGGAR